MHRLGRLLTIAAVLVFVAYVVTTRPAVAADTVHALGRAATNTASAAAQFLDDLIPKDGGSGR